MIPTIAILAAVAMLAQDILGTILTMAEAKEKAALSGALDTVGWFAAILTTTWSVTALQGHNMSEKVWVLILVSVANFAGSYTGVLIGKKLINKVKVPAPSI
jgi:hypothetical protein